MRFDLLTAPGDGVAEAYEVVDGFDGALVPGLLRPGAEQITALHALAAALSGTPLAGRVAEAVEKTVAGSVSDEHLAALAAARSALLGACHDELLSRLDEACGRTRASWPGAAGASAGGANLLAAARSWLSELAVAGWRGIDHDLVSQADQLVQALLADPPLRRLGVLLDGFAGELRACAPGATMPRVPVRRWADLWSRAVLLAQPGALAPTPGGTVSGRLLPLGVDLQEHPTAVQAQVHAVLETADGPRLVRASVSAPKVDTLAGPGTWQLLRGHCSLLAAVTGQRSVDLADMPVTAGGDLLWSDAYAVPGAPADAFATARIQLAAATAPPAPPLERHPVRIAEPVLVEGYAAAVTDDGITLTLPGLELAVDTDRMHNAGPLTPELVATSTACLGLLRWDGRWTIQPLAVEAPVKRKTTAVHAGAWAGGATDAAGAKVEAAAADAVKVLRERAGRLLRR
ncbi:hypothetical protein Cs7R123_56390 [Catellatospora sp. TT07R-123]|uniref:hypothetical protein n=1 Tax=Catellatospora sp. TT07R-123 TaxID=2733863 RepID=UPI001B1AFEFC|nr:hypothetical protein [Catellatospora sp. TT07R-123]GHJ48297.1 hypothetical protein Cs7R123_56390 [Catellatospora sp. TT07R-123]